MKYFLTIFALSFTLCAFATNEDVANPACGDENINGSGRGVTEVRTVPLQPETPSGGSTVRSLDDDE